MSSHVVRGWSHATVLCDALAWKEIREEEWCEEWEMSDVMVCHSSDICLKPYYVQLWRIDDE